MSIRKLEETLDEDSTFTEEIEHNSHICINCYRRKMVEMKPHEELPDAVTPHREYSDSIYFDYFGDEYESGRPSIKRSYCKCGAVDRIKLRPLSKNRLMEVAVRVAERLDELQIDFDEDVFFDEVRERKSDPEKQFNEEKILEIAVEKSESDSSQDDQKKVEA